MHHLLHQARGIGGALLGAFLALALVILGAFLRYPGCGIGAWWFGGGVLIGLAMTIATIGTTKTDHLMGFRTAWGSVAIVLDLSLFVLAMLAIPQSYLTTSGYFIVIAFIFGLSALAGLLVVTFVAQMIGDRPKSRSGLEIMPQELREQFLREQAKR